MAIVNPTENGGIIEIRGTLGRPCGLGRFMLGLSQFGDWNPYAGIYQRRPRKGGQIIVRMKHYRPAYRRTTAQDARRVLFADAVAEWQALTATERLEWNKAARGLRLNGYHVFLRSRLLPA